VHHWSSANGTYDPAAVIKSADAIVRAVAVEYAVPPKDPSIVIIAGTPDSKVRFKVVETLRGKVGSDLILPGRLVEQDDCNDLEPPYSFPRLPHEAGVCYANS
jgi:hypothetical protein